jgi:molybdenum cofactor cytidylyltransferase
MDALGQPFNGKMVYNIEKIVDRYGFPLETPIQPAWIAQIVRDETLGLQGIPEGVRIIPLLNRVGDSMLHRLKARRAAQMILQQERIQAVALAQIQHPTTPVVEVQRRIAAIVLAGGLSRRMGQSKPLLPWGKQTVIEAIARRLLPLRLRDVVVVTGHRSTDVKAALKGTGARTVHNRRFASGEMLSSLQTGLDALDDGVSACMVFLGDQPQISARLVHQIITAYAEGKGGIVAPSYMNRRGHPILIDRRYWPEILDLSDGSAPREVINAHSDDIAYVLTDDDGILRDMDTLTFGSGRNDGLGAGERTGVAATRPASTTGPITRSPELACTPAPNPSSHRRRIHSLRLSRSSKAASTHNAFRDSSTRTYIDAIHAILAPQYA